MIEVLIGLAGTVLGVLLSLIIGAKIKKDNQHEEVQNHENKAFRELQSAVDDLRGNPVAVDDKIREWLRK